MDTTQSLETKIKKYREKYFSNLLIKGGSIFGLLILSAFLIFTFAESIGYFGTAIRALFLFGFIGAFLVSSYIFLIKPISVFKKHSSDEDLADQIGKSIPNIKDKLLNTILLSKNQNNSLALASVQQNTSIFSAVEFDKSIDLRKAFKYLTYLLFIILFGVGLAVYNPLIFSGSTERIINFNETYEKPSAFQFSILNKDLEVFENESLTLEIGVAGSLIPKNVYLVEDGIRHKLDFVRENNLQYTFNSVHKDRNFTIESSGYSSKEYELIVLKRPSILKTQVLAQYPGYLGKNNESFSGVNQLTIPEGTKLNWNFHTKETNNAQLSPTGIDSTWTNLNNDNSVFSFSQNYTQNTNFQVKLQNEHGSNKEQIEYNINIIKDLHPKINLEAYLDTTLYQYIILGGSISDDYGLSKLKLHYRFKSTDGNAPYQNFNIPISKSKDQSYYYTWSIDSLITKREGLEYYLEVFDNDGVNGAKSSRTTVQKIDNPIDQNMDEKISKSEKNLKSNIEKSIDDLQKLNNQIDKANKKLKTEKSMSWQDKKEINKIADKQNEMQKAIEELAKEFNQLKEQQEKFDKPNEEIAEKTEQLEELLDKLMDEETKKMLEELEKLMEKKNIKPDKVSSLLEEMQKKDFNLEKELERAKSLFNKLKLDEKLQKTIDELNKLAEEQQKEAEKNQNSKMKDPTAKEEATKKQEEINKKFDKIKEELKEMEKLDKEAKTNLEKELKKNEELSEQIDQEQQEATDQLQKGDNKSGGAKQQQSSDDMKKMSESLQQMQKNMESSETAEDLDNLRKILDNLLKVSFDQENLMNTFKTIRKVNPQFLEHSAQQLKLKEDAQLIEDSLLELASRNFQIKSFVTKELFKINEHIDKSLKSIRERQIGKITGNQQFALTSINNLALMLSETMEQMQQQQSQSCSKPGSKMCNKPNGKKPSSSLSLGKKQGELSKKIQDLKKSGKSGKEQSESLAKLAAEQEQLREALKELEKMQDKGKNGKSGDMGKLSKLMEQNEIDLINKRLTEQTIKRQEEILTRLLQAEKAVRERDWKKEREAKQAKQFERKTNPTFEKYLKEKEKQIEMLKTVNPAFMPYYKQEINQYLKKL